MNKKRKVTLAGRTYDPDDLQESKKLQAQMVPDNWPGTRGECVRLYLSTAEMLAFQLKRHLAGNWKNACRASQEEGTSGGKARIGLTFKFELDHTAPSVVAITAIGMGGNMKFGTKGKPLTHDLNQGDFFEDLGEATDIDALAAEQAPAEPPPTEAPPAEGEAPPEEKAGKRSHKKKS